VRNSRGRSSTRVEPSIATRFASDTLPFSTTRCRQRKSCVSRSIFTGHTAVHDPHSVDAKGSVA
jgi:hypothetical protein